MKSLIDTICERHRLVLCELLTLGYNSDCVALVKDENDAQMVVKAATTPKALAELRMNDIGYQKLRDYGLDFFIPKIYAYHQNGHTEAYMIMEYLGPNFLTMAKEATNALSLYRRLMQGLELAYVTSRREGAEGRESLDSFIDLVIETYTIHVRPNILKHSDLLPAMQRIRSTIGIDKIRFCCFANWDFTPEDVYLTERGTMYSDPHDKVLGIPIIDMACFGGLVKLYGLPQSEQGYEEFRLFATTRVAEILEIPPHQAHQIFALGKLFQCLMSMRFRHAEHPEQIPALLQEAVTWLEKIS